MLEILEYKLIKIGRMNCGNGHSTMQLLLVRMHIYQRSIINHNFRTIALKEDFHRNMMTVNRVVLLLRRNVAQACQSLKEGRWDRKLYTGSELSGKTLAVLGLGRVGREVATRMQAYGMKVSNFPCSAFTIQKP
jgi:hypothetical protein